MSFETNPNKLATPESAVEKARLIGEMVSTERSKLIGKIKGASQQSKALVAALLMSTATGCSSLRSHDAPVRFYDPSKDIRILSSETQSSWRIFDLPPSIEGEEISRRDSAVVYHIDGDIYSVQNLKNDKIVMFYSNSAEAAIEQGPDFVLPLPDNLMKIIEEERAFQQSGWTDHGGFEGKVKIKYDENDNLIK
jgi:hypothetical protein